MQEPVTYPFTAIVDLDDLRLGVILNAINPRIGGLLIRGSKGSGKTTAVRSLPKILSKTRKVRGCPFNCSPDDLSNMCDTCRNSYSQNGELDVEEKRMRIIELPLGATEDNVVGSLDVEKAIKMGIGALARAGFANIPLHMLPMDFSIIGTAHSHPSGNLTPSHADLNHFFGPVLTIVGFPFTNEKDVAVYNRNGERLALQVTKP